MIPEISSISLLSQKLFFFSFTGALRGRVKGGAVDKGSLIPSSG